MNRLTIFVVISFLFLAVVNSAATDLISFQDNYNNLEEWLFDVNGELFEVEDFTYQKDAANFYFEKGTILLRRPVLGRPTVAIFEGKGRVTINIPSHSERQPLFAYTKDSLINEEIDYLYIRFADDFDLKLREKFKSQKGALTAKQARIAKQKKGDAYFKPIQDQYLDNYFQLLRSAYNRKEDGYFWASFDRFVYLYDPTQIEEVEVFYVHSFSDLAPFKTSKFQRQERFQQSEEKMSEVTYPTQCNKEHTSFYMSGLDGYRIDSAFSKINVTILRDSALFLSAFMDEHLKVDSVTIDGDKVQFHKRKDLRHLGIILPEWKMVGDSFDVGIWYHGIDYLYFTPEVASQFGYSHSMTLTAEESYNYAFPCSEHTKEIVGDNVVYTVKPSSKTSFPAFIPLLTGLDTISVETSWGMPVYFVMPKVGYSGALERKNVRDTLMMAIEFMYSRFGPPESVNEIFVLPGETRSFTPGLVTVSNYFYGQEQYGRLCHNAARRVALQWLTTRAQFATYREDWIREALDEYMSLLFVQSKIGNKAFYSNLDFARQTVLNMVKRDEDIPLSVGVSPIYEKVKGAWLIHMLRNLYNAKAEQSDKKLYALLNEVQDNIYIDQMTNEKFQSIAEKYFGFEMDWFFKVFLYGAGVPEYEVLYDFEKRDDGYYVKLNVQTNEVDLDFLMPILIGVEQPMGLSYYNPFIAAKVHDYELGPLADEPEDLHFNKFYSVLSKTEVSKVK